MADCVEMQISGSHTEVKLLRQRQFEGDAGYINVKTMCCTKCHDVKHARGLEFTATLFTG